MRFESTDLEGVWLITPERIPDERGFFVKTWGEDDFAAQGLAHMVARNMSYNREQATLRGMHFQQPPHAEAKLVSPLAGVIFDVAIDLRPDSPSYLRWTGRELRAEAGQMLFIPEGCAHGFVTLAPDTTVEYLISAFYAPQASGGIRWNDEFFGITWPAAPRVISARDGGVLAGRPQ